MAQFPNQENIKYLCDKKSQVSYLINIQGHPCAFCSKIHTHGEGSGHRIPHCKNTARETCLAYDGMILKREDGYLFVYEEDLQNVTQLYSA